MILKLFRMSSMIHEIKLYLIKLFKLNCNLFTKNEKIRFHLIYVYYLINLI